MKTGKAVLLGSAAALALLSGQVQADVFLGTNSTFVGGGTTDFTNTNNWDTQTYPSTSSQAYIDTVADMTNAAPNGIQAIRVGTSSGTAGVLNMHSNASLEAATHTSWDSHIGTSGRGTVNMLGGELYLNFVEIGRNNASTGTLNVASGYFRATRGSRDGEGYSVHLGANDNNSDGGVGIVNVTGGSFVTRFGIEIGSLDTTGIGTFNVQGSGAAEVTIGDTNEGKWQQYSNSVLRAGIDAGGITPISVGNGGSVQFEAGSILDVDFVDGYAGATGTWPVMTCEGTMVNIGMVLSTSAVNDGWNAGIASNTLYVAYGEDAPGDLEPPTTPLAPSDLSAQPTNAYLVALSWGEATGADSYTIYRSTTSGGSYSNIASGVTNLFYDDTTDLDAGTKYYYVLAGVNSYGEGLLSPEAAAVASAYKIITYGDPYNEDYTVYNAFDGDTTTHYDGETDDAWIGLDFGEGNELQVLEVAFVLRNWGSAVAFATNATFEGANLEDFSDAVVLATIQAPLDGNPTWNSIPVTDTDSYRYVRLMTAPQLRSKSFAEVKFYTSADYTAQGTQIDWLEGYGLTEADDLLDGDNDGLLTWEEYVAGTIPNDGTSVLELSSIEKTAAGVVLAWQSVADKTYDVISSDALIGGTETVEATVTGLDGTTTYTDTNAVGSSVFYKVEVK